MHKTAINRKIEVKDLKLRKKNNNKKNTIDTYHAWFLTQKTTTTFLKN